MTNASLTDQQIISLRCAMCDLLHVYLAPASIDVDWDGIRETIIDLTIVFPFLVEGEEERISKVINT